MRKNILSLPLIACLLIGSPASAAEPIGKCLFVSLIQDPPILASRQAIDDLIDFARKARIQILFVQIYRSNKSWFPSEVGDSAPYEESIKKVGEDPFALLIRQAHASGIEVHAWLNLLSLSANKDAKILKKYGPDILTRNLKKKKTLEDYKIDNQYFLEPGDLRIRKELLTLVEEVLHRYPDLDGIQFDYIRYPDVHPFYGYTKMNIKRFKEATGQKRIEENSVIWKDWKRRQVTELVEQLAQKARALRKGIHVSATGCEPYVRAYQEAFQDWPSWVNRGVVDSVTVMSYSTDISIFQKDIEQTKSKVTDFKKTRMAIGAYKMLDTPEIFKRLIGLCEQRGVRAYAILHYGSLLQNPALGNFLMNGKNKNENFGGTP